MSQCNLSDKKCKPCEGGVAALTQNDAEILLKTLKNWNLDEKALWINKRFVFKDFYHTMSFVNAIAFIANQEGHHPDLLVGYHYCEVRFQTHAISGLSENDFICAAKIDQLSLVAG